MSPFSIAGRQVGGDAPTYVIAEIGINHDGDEGRAAEMLAAAAAAGADAAKLQTVNVAESYMPGTPSFVEFSRRTLAEGSLVRLAAVAARHGIHLFTTPADFASLSAVREADLPAIKISSGLMTHIPLIRAAARTGKPIIMSTGLATMPEIARSAAVAREAGVTGLAILQCTSLYPAPPDALNLRAMVAIGRDLDCVFGYSDHHDGDLACTTAVALGARIIEKHFSLDRSRPGADHALSLEPEAFAELVSRIRAVEAMLGQPVKRPDEREAPARERMRRVLVARQPMPAGTVLDETVVNFMRVPPAEASIKVDHWDTFAGRRVRRDLAAGTILAPGDFED